MELPCEKPRTSDGDKLATRCDSERDEPSILAEVTFLSASEGGRLSIPEPPWGAYMPHLVIEGGIEYLGVRFVEGPRVAAGEAARFRLVLMYHPRVDYSALTSGTPFTVREGAKTVARGRVLESLSTRSA